MRQVQIRSGRLTHKHGSIVSQEKLGMNDAELDEFIAAGFAIEFEAAPAPTPAPAAEARAPELDTVSALSNSDLRREANRLNITNRSRLDRDELEDAVRAAGEASDGAGDDVPE